MTKEKCVEGKGLLEAIETWEGNLSKMEDYNQRTDKPNIWFNGYNGFLDAASGKACMAIIISHAQQRLKELQKQFDEL